MFLTGLEGLLEKVALALPAGVSPGAWRPMTPAPAVAKGPGLLRRAATPLALTGIGAGAALGLGMHHQNEKDQQQFPLTYAPLQGSLY